MDTFSAQVRIEWLPSSQIRIALREGEGGIVGFVIFIAVLCTALYWLMPGVETNPGPLFACMAVAFGWTIFGWRAEEEYVLDQASRSLTARRVGLLRRREKQVRAAEISAVRLARSGADDRFVVELLGQRRRVHLRLPRRINTLTASDQSRIGRLVAEHLGVPLQAG
jgi:hypothetical protein